MYEEIIDLIGSEAWDLAETELKRYKQEAWDDILSILAATIYFNKGDEEAAYESIRKGLCYNYKNYELYFMLGNYYEKRNINQAWLCYENAEFYCEDEKDLETIQQYKQGMQEDKNWKVNKTAFVVLSYNSLNYTKGCIESIRLCNPPASYEIIVVDNHSTDGSKEWLMAQRDIKLICNSENKGFPYGCNQGIKAAHPDADILLLNNDTLVMPNSVFWLRMGLYENNRVGATGSVTNYAGNNQMVEEECHSVEEYISYAFENNIPMRNPYEKKVFLIGFAMLIRREALDEVGLLDVRFSPGTYEDNDIGIRLHCAGWKVILCRNSFIFHYGSGGGKNYEVWKNTVAANCNKFKQKWGFDIKYYGNARSDLISLITEPEDAAISVLEIGCGLGATLARIEYLWRNAEVKGIEISEKVVSIGSNYIDMIQGNIESMVLPYPKNSFDYIIFGDVLEHLHDPKNVLLKMIPYLKEHGKFLCSLPNIMHISVLAPLLRGEFEYTNEGILDRTHLRFFTLNSICKMMAECRLNIEELISMRNPVADGEMEMLEILEKIPGTADRDQYLTYQYVFRAGK